MNEQRFEEYLQHFGLTRQEANVYRKLLVSGKQTGYEIAKETGISRSNVYNALSALTEKGAAYLVEETAKKYVPVQLEEFCDNCIRRMNEEKSWMVKNFPGKPVAEEGYITIEGAGHISDKVKTLLKNAEERVYISCTSSCLKAFEQELSELLKMRKKVVIITDDKVAFDQAMIYISESKGRQIGVITDSKYVLTGEYGDGSLNTCLYSGQKNFVELFKTALANEIKLITLRGENV